MTRKGAPCPAGPPPGVGEDFHGGRKARQVKAIDIQVGMEVYYEGPRLRPGWYRVAGWLHLAWIGRIVLEYGGRIHLYDCSERLWVPMPDYDPQIDTIATLGDGVPVRRFNDLSWQPARPGRFGNQDFKRAKQGKRGRWD